MGKRFKHSAFIVCHPYQETRSYCFEIAIPNGASLILKHKANNVVSGLTGVMAYGIFSSGLRTAKYASAGMRSMHLKSSKALSEFFNATIACATASKIASLS